MNVWCVVGRIGQDAEVRFTNGGTAVCQFSVATTAGYGERKSTTWARCNLFGKRAESLAPYLVKGQQVAVTGEAKLHEWTNKAGETKQSLEVNVNDVTLVGGKPEGRPAQQTAAKAGIADARQAAQPDNFDEDVPF